jgi:hypothetical protein
VDSSGNQEEPNIKSSQQLDLSSKDDLALGLPTPDKQGCKSINETSILS